MSLCTRHSQATFPPLRSVLRPSTTFLPCVHRGCQRSRGQCRPGPIPGWPEETLQVSVIHLGEDLILTASLGPAVRMACEARFQPPEGNGGPKEEGDGAHGAGLVIRSPLGSRAHPASTKERPSSERRPCRPYFRGPVKRTSHNHQQSQVGWEKGTDRPRGERGCPKGPSSSRPHILLGLLLLGCVSRTAQGHALLVFR